jgi:hypothetical protein
MTKMIPPKGMTSLSIDTPRGQKSKWVGKDGLLEINDPKLVKKLKQEGLGVASASGVIANSSAVGSDCKACGFGSFFKKCSKVRRDKWLTLTPIQHTSSLPLT